MCFYGILAGGSASIPGLVQWKRHLAGSSLSVEAAATFAAA
jgi:hypothetical protein